MGFRARHRAADAFRQPGSPDRRLEGNQGRAAHDLDEPPARPPRIHVLPVELHPRCGTRTPASSPGQFQSIFQVATNPGRPIIYAGCVLVVVRGISSSSTCGREYFTDGGKKERERALRKRKRKTQPKLKPKPEPEPEDL